VMRRRGLLLLAAGLIAAIAAAILVFELSQGRTDGGDGRQAAIPTATPIPVEQVVIAARDIAPRQPVTAADVVTRTYPVGVVQADAIRDPASVISMTATTQIFSGQTLLTRQFDPNAAPGPAPPASTTIPAGKVLMAFPATGMLESTGAVQAGDHVDIMITLPVSGTIDLPSNGAPAQGRPGDRSIVSQATLQNVTVYNTGLWTPQAGAAAAAAAQPVKVITFIVDHQEALILKYIKDSGGTIDLVIRSAKDTNPVATDPVSLDYLVDLFRFVTLPSR
jgi:pilus assembly protein CpaB